MSWHLNLWVGWIGILGGAISGSIIGLFFHRDEWAGGYNSFRRRMIRLGHISFFGIGLLNIALGLTPQSSVMPHGMTQLASFSMITAAVTMPLLCFMTAWHKAFRHLFPIPVLGVLVAVIVVLAYWPPS